jgi:hypothetical protein
MEAIDRELRSLQSELGSLEGQFDSKRFLGATQSEFFKAMVGMLSPNGWTCDEVTDHGFIVNSVSYEVRSSRSNKMVKVQIKSDRALVQCFDTWQTCTTVGSFKDTLTQSLM